jgi:hypothetical protein
LWKVFTRTIHFNSNSCFSCLLSIFFVIFVFWVRKKIVSENLFFHVALTFYTLKTKKKSSVPYRCRWNRKLSKWRSLLFKLCGNDVPRKSIEKAFSFRIWSKIVGNRATGKIKSAISKVATILTIIFSKKLLQRHNAVMDF